MKAVKKNQGKNQSQRLMEKVELKTFLLGPMGSVLMLVKTGKNLQIDCWEINMEKATILPDLGQNITKLKSGAIEVLSSNVGVSL